MPHSMAYLQGAQTTGATMFPERFEHLTGSPHSHYISVLHQGSKAGTSYANSAIHGITRRARTPSMSYTPKMKRIFSSRVPRQHTARPTTKSSKDILPVPLLSSAWNRRSAKEHHRGGRTNISSHLDLHSITIETELRNFCTTAGGGERKASDTRQKSHHWRDGPLLPKSLTSQVGRGGLEHIRSVEGSGFVYALEPYVACRAVLQPSQQLLRMGGPLARAPNSSRGRRGCTRTRPGRPERASRPAV